MPHENKPHRCFLNSIMLKQSFVLNMCSCKDVCGKESSCDRKSSLLYTTTAHSCLQEKPGSYTAASYKVKGQGNSVVYEHHGTWTSPRTFFSWMKDSIHYWNLGKGLKPGSICTGAASLYLNNISIELAWRRTGNTKLPRSVQRGETLQWTEFKCLINRDALAFSKDAIKDL